MVAIQATSPAHDLSALHIHPVFILCSKQHVLAINESHVPKFNIVSLHVCFPLVWCFCSLLVSYDYSFSQMVSKITDSILLYYICVFLFGAVNQLMFWMLEPGLCFQFQEFKKSLPHNCETGSFLKDLFLYFFSLTNSGLRLPRMRNISGASILTLSSSSCRRGDESSPFVLTILLKYISALDFLSVNR